MTAALQLPEHASSSPPGDYEPYSGPAPVYIRPSAAEITERRRQGAMGFRWRCRYRKVGLTAIAKPYFDRTRGVFGFNLLMWRAMFSLGVTHYRPGPGLRDHKDCDHPNWVATLVLWRPRRGGDFHVCGPSIFRSARLNVFRGDLYQHHVQAHEGSRWILMAQFALDAENAA